MPRINIVGIGPGDRKTMTEEAVGAIQNSRYLIGDKRVLEPFEHFRKEMFYSSNVKEINNYLTGLGQEEEASVLVSGDVGFYSLAKRLLETGKREEIRLICGLSSLQVFCSRLGIPWQDVNVLSLHGRDGNVLNRVMRHRTVFIMTGGSCTPAAVCRELCRSGLETVRVSVGENLSYPGERITTGTAEALAEEDFAELSVMLVFNNSPVQGELTTSGLPDGMFIRGDAPMTKQEIRAVVLSKLQLAAGDTVYDIGAGTGSVAVEMALRLTEGTVFAIEKEPGAVDLLQQNKQKFAAYNLHILQAAAPEGLAALPCPDKAFIGGSGGRLKDILDLVYAKNPRARVVLTAITLQTLTQAAAYYEGRTDLKAEIIQVGISKAQKLGGYHLLTGQNPVFVITAESGALA
ncbi:precorrin-6y C5,15-methyltransferase (decarboxylating), CbiE subunit [Syntrophobotulus glycolicus DSM 8271]|uniref:Precorrin-6y C5,15-methyltransferase (Decarboxylating), CbiE subunit n=1 Tax=Syntrophobotulus glycolicus (strain DSM 8271 / FlGlyR) TaxID=645991 RepID=F0SZ36_SYNGF|nr:bifunctional cobalt-precorrin-7 (C(5))-methyltransferase/cobalt-precorrin-6B (C(15))-methyltransferase [Syntrophobotulus glycolicus]ADY57154.1 precorrin-6y C5,15-methyltransferase (decarboxylating), CbiE subunit [Syntrophobotulus glycolicus DSM 8271]